MSRTVRALAPKPWQSLVDARLILQTPRVKPHGDYVKKLGRWLCYTRDNDAWGECRVFVPLDEEKPLRPSLKERRVGVTIYKKVGRNPDYIRDRQIGLDWPECCYDAKLDEEFIRTAIPDQPFQQTIFIPRDEDYEERKDAFAEWQSLHGHVYRNWSARNHPAGKRRMQQIERRSTRRRLERELAKEFRDF